MLIPLLTVLIGCSSPPPATPPAPVPIPDAVILPVEPPATTSAVAPSCEEFASHLRTLFRTDISRMGDPTGKVGVDVLLERIDAMSDGVLERCKAHDHTEELADVTSCIVAAKSVAEIQSCRSLYPEQGEALHAWMMGAESGE